MKKVLPLLASAILFPTLAATASVTGLSLKSQPQATTAALGIDGTVKELINEDFSLMTAGSEGNPSSEYLADDSNNIPSSKTKMPGWMGYYLREAGGMVYIGLDPKEIESGVLMTPKVDATEAGGVYSVSFRARSAVSGSFDKIYVDGKKSVNEAMTKEVKISDQWEYYTVKFDNGGPATYVMFSPWLDAAYIDDVKIEVIIPKIFAPKNLSFDNYTGTGFSAHWEAVEKATGYLLSVYTKNSDGSRDYYLEKEPVDGLDYDLTNLPVKESFYYFMVQATDGVNVSPESVEMVVEALLRPELLPETEVSATGFRANWNPVNLANNYNFIATQEHAAASFEQYNFVNEDFKNVSALSGYYDYTSIPELPGWTIASPKFKDGEIGINSSNGMYGSDAWIQSSIYDFSNAGGNVNVKMSIYCDYKNDKYKSDILVGLYTYSEVDKRYKVTDYVNYQQVGNAGADIDIVLKGGGKKSLVMIEPDGYATLMIKNLQVSQNLLPGDNVTKTIVSKSTTEPTLKVEGVNLAEGDKVSYTVRAVGRNSTDTGTIYSDYTAPQYVELTNASVDDIIADGDGVYVVYNLQGIKVMETENVADVNNLPKGIYIVNGSKVVVR